MVLDTEYLKNTVGDALTRGCAATATIRPTDSIEYLAKWLHKYVKNESIKERFFAEKAAAEESAAKVKAEADATATREQATRSAQNNAIESLNSLVGDPFALFATVAEIVEANTTAGMVYIGSLQTDEWELPGLAEDDDGEDAPELEDVGEEPEPETPPEGEGLAGNKFNYQAKHISYVCSSVGAEFMVGKELRRPMANAEAGVVLGKPGVTLAITDQGVLVVDVPNVLYKVDEVKFFKPVPRVGAYYAQTLNNADSGEVKAVLCADTTITLGKGRPFTPADKQFMTEVAAKVSKCLAATDAKLVEYAAKATDAHAPPPPPAESEEAPSVADETPATTEEVETAPQEEEPTAKLEKAKAVLNAAAAAVVGVKADAVAILKLYQTAPPATATLVRGVLAMLANSTADASLLKWPVLRAKIIISGEIFDDVADFDASAVLLSDKVTKFLRRSYVTLRTRELWKESPLGEPLKDYVIKARAVMKLAAVVKAVEAEAAAAAPAGDEAPALEETPSQ
mmetsp:Transcript_31137/g.77492  ORF Transcript_31137/g.77492 Transcript_31137/m.77492 type:complete len:512 (-) Transcript_31137:119-1654(-)|eukprot:CAMPEP_0197574306 /NCGR_PEP_ID=MMETSP1326-20131121/51_1 /TAXON_ID=1155430 /ORGANISM="Genus nov. species nov., Strain RCC2288" /LENGTH=511 /DNA_ID=CAMNT_0043136853 /DNA_START=251 /DNA_END=1789 /DNA_ORIENTATION=+